MKIKKLLNLHFQYARKTAKPDTSTYVCMYCKKLKKYTAIMVKGEDFLDDPVMLDHSCLPVEQGLQDVEKPQCIFIAVDPVLAQNRRRYRNNVMRRCTKEDVRFDIAKEVANVGGPLTPEIDMLRVPDESLPLRWSPFLQLQEQEMHIYLSDEVTKLAVDAGFYALIGDGIHQLNRRNKRGSRTRVEKGQVYTTLGVCRGGNEFLPLMFTITRNKREQGYMVIFQQLREALVRANAEQQLTQRDECSLAPCLPCVHLGGEGNSEKDGGGMLI
ncbi:unnamed protein product [Strongylus vulgaris]|uniref:Uncharacterized protein n=1 Tax=Strongylus vulgaris TaxID=40348 RepID=A0A3P7K5M7_STRVU|nr:unnamed protein product [Strongylus vulgaris]